MKTLDIKSKEKLIESAQQFSKFRTDCKNFLIKNNLIFDKFTIVNHDSEVGYMSERIIADYLKEKLIDTDLKIIHWEDSFNISAVRESITTNKNPEVVKDYFYDLYDLRIYNDKIDIRIDIKSALTMKTPSSKWNFMYPVVQAHKQGKDGMILAYCVTKDNNIRTIDNIVVAGYTTEEKIKKCKIIKKGNLTRFGTISQIDNYETELSTHYIDIDEFITFLKEISKK